MKSLIALSGPKGSGKSTLAELLVKHHDYVRLPFAGGLKSMLASLMYYQGAGVAEVDAYIDGDQKEKPCPYLDGRTPRHAMQTLGTEWRDLISRDLWTNIWERSSQVHKKVVVDDLRFVHEAVRVRRFAGSFIVGIVRPNLPKSFDPHPSETEILRIATDFQICNDTDPKSMLRQLVYVLGDNT